MKFALVAAACEGNGIGINNKLPWKIKTDMQFFNNFTSTTYEKPLFSSSPARYADNTPSLSIMNSVLMGRNTWNSIPTKYRPLANRFNVVISRSLCSSYDPDQSKFGEWSLVRPLHPDAYAVPSLETAFELCRLLAGEVEDVAGATALPVVAELRSRIHLQNHFIIGGQQIYELCICRPECARIYLTRIERHYDADTFFPEIDSSIFERITDYSRIPEIPAGDHGNGEHIEGDVKFRFEMYERNRQS